MKARDWPSALRRGAGMRGGSLGGRTRADVPTIPNMKRRPPWCGAETSEEVDRVPAAAANAERRKQSEDGVRSCRGRRRGSDRRLRAVRDP